MHSERSGNEGESSVGHNVEPATLKRSARTPIPTYAVLLENELAIVERINAMPNGPMLFLTHPFRFLEDLGLELAPAVREQILRRHPELDAVGDAPYESLKKNRLPQKTEVRLHGLFRPDGR